MAGPGDALGVAVVEAEEPFDEVAVHGGGPASIMGP
jgi:hypothetical protein